MRIKKVSDTKVTFFISPTDLEEWNIDLKEFWNNGPRMQRLFWELLDWADREFGFEVGDEPLMVETIGLPPEGFILVVSKGPLEQKGSGEEKKKDSKSSLERESPRLPGVINPKITPPHDLVFAFLDIEDVFQAGQALAGHSDLNSTLYRMDKRYYLAIKADEILARHIESVTAILGEYGSRQGMSEAYLAEYATVIVAQKALQLVGNIFR